MPLSATYGTDEWLAEAREVLTQYPCPVCDNNTLGMDWDFRMATEGVTKEVLIICQTCGRRFRGRSRV